jgi:chromosomal replication initiation ATPase DnaA
VSGRKPAESRFEARHRTGVTPLVGGDEELGCLLRRWEQAKSGEGQIVLLCGEAGIGKSRLVASFREELGSEAYARVIPASVSNDRFRPRLCENVMANRGCTIIRSDMAPLKHEGFGT